MLPAVVAGNVIAAGDTVIDGIGGGLAVPVNGTELVAPAALWAIVTVEDFAPVVVGRKRRSILHAAAVPASNRRGRWNWFRRWHPLPRAGLTSVSTHHYRREILTHDCSQRGWRHQLCAVDR